MDIWMYVDPIDPTLVLTPTDGLIILAILAVVVVTLCICGYLIFAEI